MAYSQTDIDTLKAAIATGALEVAFGAGPDRRLVKYRNLNEMKDILADMIAEVSPSAAPPRVSVVEHGRW